MTIRSRIEILSLIAAVLSVGIATAAEARGFGHLAPHAVATEHVVAAFRRAPIEHTGIVGHLSTNGAPTLPGCTSQAGCRTVTGGYLNGRPVGGGTEGGNGGHPSGPGASAPTQGASKPPFPKPTCTPNDCGWRNTGPIPTPSSGPISPASGGGSNNDPGVGGGQSNPSNNTGPGDITDPVQGGADNNQGSGSGNASGGGGGSVERCFSTLRCHETN